MAIRGAVILFIVIVCVTIWYSADFYKRNKMYPWQYHSTDHSFAGMIDSLKTLINDEGENGNEIMIDSTMDHSDLISTQREWRKNLTIVSKWKYNKASKKQGIIKIWLTNNSETITMRGVELTLTFYDNQSKIKGHLTQSIENDISPLTVDSLSVPFSVADISEIKVGLGDQE